MGTKPTVTEAVLADLTPGPPLPVPAYRPLGERMIAASQRLTWIQKRGKNDFHKYNYAMAADVFAAVREALNAEGIAFVASVLESSTRQVEGLKGLLSEIKLEVRFSAADNLDDCVCVVAPGAGADTGDKGIYKAMTGALKYALILPFLLPTGDDPEADSKVDERGAAPATVTEAELFALEEWLSQVEGSATKVLETLKIKALSDLTPETYRRAMDWIRRKVEANKRGDA